MTALPSATTPAARTSPRRFLAVLRLARRECGNCESFSLVDGQHTLSKIEHFEEVMRHVSPMQIGRADPIGLLEREREAISPRFIAIEIETTPLYSRLRASQEMLDSLAGSAADVAQLKGMIAELDTELAPLASERDAIVAKHPRLLEIEKEIDAIRDERRARVATPEEQWKNYGACHKKNQLFFNGDRQKCWS